MALNTTVLARERKVWRPDPEFHEFVVNDEAALAPADHDWRPDHVHVSVLGPYKGDPMWRMVNPISEMGWLSRSDPLHILDSYTHHDKNLRNLLVALVDRSTMFVVGFIMPDILCDIRWATATVPGGRRNWITQPTFRPLVMSAHTVQERLTLEDL